MITKEKAAGVLANPQAAMKIRHPDDNENSAFCKRYSQCRYLLSGGLLVRPRPFCGGRS